MSTSASGDNGWFYSTAVPIGGSGSLCRSGRFIVCAIAILIEKPRSLMDPHLMSEGVFEPILVGEIR